MGTLNRPLKVWHGLVGVTLALLLGVGGTAIATSANTPASRVSLGSEHGYTYVRHHFTNEANSQDQGVAGCDRDEVVVGGGALGDLNGSAQFLNSTYPHDDGDRGHVPDGWAIFMNNETGKNLDAYVYAICKRVD